MKSFIYERKEADSKTTKGKVVGKQASRKKRRRERSGEAAAFHHQRAIPSEAKALKEPLLAGEKRKKKEKKLKQSNQFKRA